MQGANVQLPSIQGPQFQGPQVQAPQFQPPQVQVTSAPAGTKTTNYLPLVLIMGGLLLVAIVLVVYFAVR
jgi:hypothetical protein